MDASIDFGNTQSKLGFFEGKKLAAMHVCADMQDLRHLLKAKKPKRIMLSSVGQPQASFVKELSGIAKVHQLRWDTPLPIINAYRTPQTLGMDRVAGVVGAWQLFPHEASLVIDIGTCITYDFITAKGVYLGGSISPGMRMRAKAMHAFTARLPEISDFEGEMLVGDTTEACLRSGVVQGLLAEIEGTVLRYQGVFGIFNTLLCGGDAFFFERKTKASIFVRQEVVLLGLNAILHTL